jgi:thiol-disulfide isomerase/thioredoxin
MLLAALIVATTAGPPASDTAQLTLVPKGGMAKIGYYAPQRVEFGPDRPAALTAVPDGLTAPSYGVLPIGGGTGTLFVLDEPAGGKARLFVDTNRNGDLRDDPACEWTGKQTRKDDDTTTTMHQGTATVDIGEPGRPLPVGLGLYRFDPADPDRAALKSTLLYYRDYAAEGTLDLGGTSYSVMLDDSTTRGDFRGKAAAGAAAADGGPGGGEEGSGVTLLIDANRNGRFDSRGEAFDAGRPFNIGGTTWELADIARDGTSLRVVKSAQEVAEVATPPDHSAGRTITPFTATDTDGKALSFPADYRGKVVLLDFWATWCGPCMKEMPNVVAAYGKHHGDGFEVQGISLDDGKTVKRMPEVMQGAGMTWRQVADAKGWKAEIAQLYAISSIPATFLVDGTTGEILGTNLRGKALDDAVAKALAGRKSE